VALVQTASGIVGRAHSLTQQNQEVTTDLMFQQMDMANVYLDVAANTLMNDHKYQCIAQATGARNKVSRWLESGRAGITESRRWSTDSNCSVPGMAA